MFFSTRPEVHKVVEWVPVEEGFGFDGRTFAVDGSESQDGVCTFFLSELNGRDWHQLSVFFECTGPIADRVDMVKQAALNWLQDRKDGKPWPPEIVAYPRSPEKS